MPYGDLARARVQRFATRADLDAAACTAEEREEYEPWLEAGGVVFAGVDYAAILAEAEREADVLVWDGGNNDFPFLRPDLHLVLVDALRPDQVATHHPGEAVARMADAIVVNKVGAAAPAQVQEAIEAARRVNPRARVLRADSPVALDDPAAVRGRRVVVVDDGPTLTHGGMRYGAGWVAAVAAGAAEIVDPRPYAEPGLRAAFARHPHLERVLPALGYGREQLEELRRTLDAVPADVIVAGTPVDLAALVPLRLPVVRARYGFAEVEEPGLGALVDAFADRLAAERPRAS
jgi:predicted GTPase